MATKSRDGVDRRRSGRWNILRDKNHGVNKQNHGECRWIAGAVPKSREAIPLGRGKLSHASDCHSEKREGQPLR